MFIYNIFTIFFLIFLRSSPISQTLHYVFAADAFHTPLNIDDSTNDQNNFEESQKLRKNLKNDYSYYSGSSVLDLHSGRKSGLLSPYLHKRFLKLVLSILTDRYVFLSFFFVAGLVCTFLFRLLLTIVPFQLFIVSFF